MDKINLVNPVNPVQKIFLLKVKEVVWVRQV